MPSSTVSEPKFSGALFISANDYASEALRLMRLHRMNSMPVRDGQHVLGCVYEQDMMTAPLGRLKEQDVKAFVRACAFQADI